MSPLRTTNVSLVAVALTMLVLASQCYQSEAAALRRGATRRTTRMERQLARLLTEGGGALLTHDECLALPVFFSPSTNNAAGCGFLPKWGGWPTAEGNCQDGVRFDGTLSDAVTKCDGYVVGAKLWAPANDAERCTMTHYAEGLSQSGHNFLTGITDAATEGVWLGPDGEDIDPVYLNWATGQPDGGAAENCLVYRNNEAYDMDCGAIPGDTSGPNQKYVMCHVRLAAA